MMMLTRVKVQTIHSQLRWYVVALEALDKLKPAVQHLIDELKVKEEKYMKTVKVGRTHLQKMLFISHLVKNFLVTLLP